MSSVIPKVCIIHIVKFLPYKYRIKYRLLFKKISEIITFKKVYINFNNKKIDYEILKSKAFSTVTTLIFKYSINLDIISYFNINCLKRIYISDNLIPNFGRNLIINSIGLQLTHIKYSKLEYINIIKCNNLLHLDCKNTDFTKAFLNYFPNLVFLRCARIIYDINFLTKLKTLKSYINDINNICNLNLFKLNVSGNPLNIDLSCFKYLKKLDCSGAFCEIREVSDNHVNLVKLNIKNNTNITTIPQTHTLKKLNCSFTKIPVSQFIYLNLTTLIIKNYSMAVNLNSMESLTELDCSYSLINNLKLINLKKLTCSNCETITNLNYMTNLKKLNCSYTNINNFGIRKLNLKSIKLNHNNGITDLNHMTNLKVVKCDYSKLHNNGIAKLNLVKLSAVENKHIYDLNHMTNLKYLNCSGRNSVIKSEGIKNLNLIVVNCVNNPNKLNLTHMSNLKYTDIEYAQVPENY